MILTFHGGGCIKASAGDTTLVFSPVSKSSKKIKPANFGADVALISIKHPDANGSEQVARSGKETFVVDGAGEYEIGPVTIEGVTTSSKYDGDERINTVYHVKFDGLSLLYLGAMGEAKIPKEIVEDVDVVDILCVPIGGEGVLTPAEAQKIAVQLEAKIVIPIFYGEVGEKDALKRFLKEAGAEDVKPVDKSTLKPRDVADRVGDVIVLAE